MGGGFSASASSGAGGGTAGGSTAWSSGDWNINLGGTGTSLQGAGSISPILLAVAAVAALWFLSK